MLDVIDEAVAEHCDVAVVDRMAIPGESLEDQLLRFEGGQPPMNTLECQPVVRHGPSSSE